MCNNIFYELISRFSIVRILPLRAFYVKNCNTKTVFLCFWHKYLYVKFSSMFHNCLFLWITSFTFSRYTSNAFLISLAASLQHWWFNTITSNLKFGYCGFSPFLTDRFELLIILNCILCKQSIVPLECRPLLILDKF